MSTRNEFIDREWAPLQLVGGNELGDAHRVVLGDLFDAYTDRDEARATVVALREQIATLLTEQGERNDALGILDHSQIVPLVKSLFTRADLVKVTTAALTAAMRSTFGVDPETENHPVIVAQMADTAEHVVTDFIAEKAGT